MTASPTLVRELLGRHGTLESQDKGTWTGEVPLPGDLASFYNEVGPANITIEGYRERCPEAFLITTSGFSKGSIEVAKRARGLIHLVNGEKLLELMVEHGIGLCRGSYGEIVRETAAAKDPDGAGRRGANADAEADAEPDSVPAVASIKQP